VDNLGKERIPKKAENNDLRNKPTTPARPATTPRGGQGRSNDEKAAEEMGQESAGQKQMTVVSNGNSRGAAL